MLVRVFQWEILHLPWRCWYELLFDANATKKAASLISELFSMHGISWQCHQSVELGCTIRLALLSGSPMNSSVSTSELGLLSSFASSFSFTSFDPFPGNIPHWQTRHFSLYQRHGNMRQCACNQIPITYWLVAKAKAYRFTKLCIFSS